MSTPLLSCDRVSLSYDGVRHAVREVSFEVHPGSIFALVGPNGAGKTSTLRMLATLTDPSAGTLRVDGIDLARDREAVRRRVGYLPDNFALYDAMTPVDYLDFFARCHGVPSAERRRRSERLLDELDLGGKREAPIRSLSRGMRQRLGLAKTLIHDPKVLLLDEPASALDPAARLKLRDVLAGLKRRGLAIVISSHILPDLAGLADSVGIMEGGRMIRTGAIDAIARAAKNERTVYCIDIRTHVDRAERALADFGPRVGRFERTAWDGGAVRFEVELEGGEETAAELVEALVLRGARVSHVAPRESALEAVYRASAASAVA
ncbi:MAG: ABC transporter ATP-binding protein [Myxococcales bacterium]|nr:ABC transporter ATP-binding protein [Myxococcales bacterium]